MSSIVLKVLSYSEAAADIKAIRQVVFQVEQGVDPTLDFDGLDETSQHIVAYLDQKPIGTARIRYLTDQLAKIERVAVLSAHRGQGIGKQIMAAAIDFLDRQNMPESKVHAQSHAAAFYQKLGFQQQGEAFHEAGILHIEMRRSHPALQ
ncbi:MAG: GNAT family N-acetyltransferase [Leptolyngbya sp. IPPAS B-1204]|nr:MAG: GNAT family N-acetyltransferase [Leptolyngbya sp. IPPAS B-1204]